MTEQQGPERRGPQPLPLFLALLQRQLGASPERLAAALQGLRRYQQAAALPALPPLAEVARIGGVRLLDAGGPQAGSTAAPTLVLVPSIINSSRILDLGPGRSLLRHLAADGHRVLLLDWGPMGASERRLGLAGLVSLRLLPLLERLSGQVALAGYCLGGTLAVAAGQLLGERLSKLALIAAPWHFSAYSEQARADAARAWEGIDALGRALGAVPLPLLNPLFWSLDEGGIAAKFEALAVREGARGGAGESNAADPSLAFFAAIEDWAGSGAPLPLPAARDLFRHAFGTDQIGRGRWRVRGQLIAPEKLAAPILDISASTDRIVPPATRVRAGNVRHLDADCGHVGLVIGRAAERQLWQPLSNWLHER